MWPLDFWKIREDNLRKHERKCGIIKSDINLLFSFIIAGIDEIAMVLSTHTAGYCVRSVPPSVRPSSTKLPLSGIGLEFGRKIQSTMKQIAVVENGYVWPIFVRRTELYNFP